MRRKVIVIGGGFAGINFIKHSRKAKDLQITLVDKNNYNFFAPLLYQVGTGFLEPSSISYPFRKLVKDYAHVHFRMGQLQSVNSAEKTVTLNNGVLEYDDLILATGTIPNFYNLTSIEEHAIPMKSLSEALYMRNQILQCLETATITSDPKERQKLLTIVIAGGGPTGVEIAGLLSEMGQRIFPKEYNDLHDFKRQQKIILVNGASTLLVPMSNASQEYSKESLEKMGVEVLLNTFVKDYDGDHVSLSNGTVLETKTLIWASGVTGYAFPGLEAFVGHGNRLLCDAYNQVINSENIYALGDISLLMQDENFPKGHPQVAQVAIQQAKQLANNFKNRSAGKPFRPFQYIDRGSMAIIGRNKAVADLPRKHFKGLIAWLLWLFIHLFSLLTYRNRIKTFFNWATTFFTRDISLRLIVRPKRND